MPTKPAKRNAQRTVTPSKLPTIKRQASGQFAPGQSGFAGRGSLDIARARRTLNLMTIEGMTRAFERGGQDAIEKVMRNSPAQFLKLAVLLVPRELEVSNTSNVQGLSDEQLARSIEVLEAMIARRAAKPGDDAKVIDVEPTGAAPVAPPAEGPEASEA